MKKIFIILIIFLTSVVLCMSAIPNVKVNTDYKYYSDIRYGSYKRNKLDICIPGKINYTGMILYIHGGAWITGSKDVYKDQMISDAINKNIVTAAISYHYISNRFSCYDIINDITNAISKIKETLEALDIKIDKLMLSGGSAGAHLSLLYGYKYGNISPIVPVCVISYSGPTDLLCLDYYNNNEYKDSIYDWFPKLSDYKFDESNLEDAYSALKEVSPIYHIENHPIPTIICQGGHDEIIPVKNGLDLHNRLDELHVENSYFYFPNSGHGLESDPLCMELANEALDSYIELYLK